MANFLKEPFSLFPSKPTRSISVVEDNNTLFEFKGYITINEDAQDELEITQHPVQQGANIADHSFKKPTTLKTKIQANDNDAPIDEIYESLLKIQNDRSPVKVVTKKRVYQNMLLKVVQETTDETTENVLALTLTLEEVIIVNVSPTIVPPRSKQSNPGSTGATEKAGRKSALAITKEGIVSFLGGLR